jgi:pimeloyl-ACP methyl ester carboxylesterase
MNPFYFGSSKEPLFGVYHPPLALGSMDSAVILCPPLMQDYMRAHWSLRRLADLLSRVGFHVLRFDYFGTGDSAGKSSDGTIERWHADIRSAASELLELSGRRLLSVVGLRAGAALAATTEGLDIKDLVLWDPIISGHNYVKKLRLINRSKLLGFPFPPTMQDSIERIDLLSESNINAENIFIFSTRTIEEMPQLQKVFQMRGAKFVEKTVDDVGDWDQHSRIHDTFLPNAIPLAIVDVLARK